jgi:hypothetical protein
MATYTLISSNVLASSAASVTFSAIPATYTDLVIRLSARGDQAAQFNNLYLTFNNQSIGSNTYLIGDGSAAASGRNTFNGFQYTRIDNNGANSTSNTFSNVEFYFPSYLSTSSKPFSTSAANEQNSATAYISAQAGLHANTYAIDSIDIAPSAGNFVSTSSFYLYGISNA